MFNINDIKNGITFLFEGNIYTVMEFQHVKPGKGAAFVKAKIRNLRTINDNPEKSGFLLLLMHNITII